MIRISPRGGYFFCPFTKSYIWDFVICTSKSTFKARSKLQNHFQSQFRVSKSLSKLQNHSQSPFRGSKSVSKLQIHSQTTFKRSKSVSSRYFDFQRRCGIISTKILEVMTMNRPASSKFVHALPSDDDIDTQTNYQGDNSIKIYDGVAECMMNEANNLDCNQKIK